MKRYCVYLSKYIIFLTFRTGILFLLTKGGLIVKRVLTVFLAVIFMISSMWVPAFADESIIVDIDTTVDVSDDAQTEAVEETDSDISDENPEIQLGDDLSDYDAEDDADADADADMDPAENNNEESDETDADLFGEGWDFSDDVIDLLALGSDYYDSESFEASPKVFTQDFEGEFNLNLLGVDIDVSGQINYSNDISVIKGSDAKYGDEEGEVGISDVTTGTDEGSFLMWTNRQTDADCVFKFFDVFNRDGLTHADKNDKYALRFKLFIPRVDGLTRDILQIKLGTYSSMLYNENGTYPSETPTAYTTTAKQENTFIVPTGEWVDVFWDNNGSGLVPGQLIVNQLGISSRMAFTTMYIDDLTVVRTEKVSSYTVDASDMQPLESQYYVKTGVTAETDEGQQVLKVAPGGSLKYSPTAYTNRFIAEEGGKYKINFKTKNAANIKVTVTNTYIDRSKLDGTDYKTTIINDFHTEKNLSTADFYAESIYLYTDPGCKTAVDFGGKKADLFRAINFENVSADQDAYIYDITVSKVNKFSPLSPLNAEFDNWGGSHTRVAAPSFVYNKGKLNVNAVLNDLHQSISSYVPLVKGAEYQMNYKAMSTDGETFKLQILDGATKELIHETSNVLTGTEKEYCDTFKIEGDYSENVLYPVIVRITTTNKALTVSDLKFSLINDVIELDTSEENSILVTGDLRDYTVNAPKAYLILDSYDYRDSSAVKAEANVVLNPDRTYEVLFDNTGDIFDESYYNNINVVLVGIDGIPYVAKSVYYESAKIRADLIRAIATASDYNAIDAVIRGKSGADQINNDIILKLDELDFYTSTKSFVSDVAKVLYEYKDVILNPDNNADLESLYNEYLFAATLAGANTKKLSSGILVDYTDRIKERILVEEEAVYENFYLTLDENGRNGAMASLMEYAFADNCFSEAEYKKAFLDGIFKNKLNNCITYSDVMVYITNYKTFLGIDNTEWAPLEALVNTGYYTEAQIKIAEFAKSVFDIHTIDDNISRLVQDAIDAVDYINSSYNGPSGSGGGGGGGGSSNIIIPPIVNTEINVTTDDNNYSPKPAVEFSDLSEFDWAKDHIDTLISTGAITGYEDGTFRPANNITRAEFAKILSVALDAYDEDATCEYTDIPADNWGVSYIGSLAKLDVIKGKPDGSFGANDHITRQDVAVLVYRLVNKLGIKLPVVNRPVPFADDAEISDYAKEAVNALYQAGVISGVGDYRFDPNGYANRAQAAKIIAFFVK